MTPDQQQGIDSVKQLAAVGAVVVGTASTQIVGANSKRRTLHLIATTATIVWVGVASPMAANLGLPLSQAGGGIKLTIEEHGSIVRNAWYGIGGAVGDAVGFIDVNDGT